MIIYQITIPKKENIEVFVKFMNEEYSPAVHKGQTRVGQVTYLILLERENEFEGDNVRNEFLWHVGWSGQPTGEVHIDDPEKVRRFEAFKAEVKRLGSYEEVAVRREQISL